MLAITGGKGGCGKTTTTIGLARNLTRDGHDPIVVDADCDMPDVHHVARFDRNFGVDRLAEGHDPASVFQRSDRFPGVRFVTAGDRRNVDAALRRLSTVDAPILIDCPAGISPDATRPLRHADRALLVSTDEPVCLDDASRTITAARELDTELFGAFVVVVAGSPPPAIDGVSVLASAERIQDPFRARKLRAAWGRVIDAWHRYQPTSAVRPARWQRNRLDV